MIYFFIFLLLSNIYNIHSMLIGRGRVLNKVPFKSSPLVHEVPPEEVEKIRNMGNKEQNKEFILDRLFNPDFFYETNSKEYAKYSFIGDFMHFIENRDRDGELENFLNFINGDGLDSLFSIYFYFKINVKRFKSFSYKEDSFKFFFRTKKVNRSIGVKSIICYRSILLFKTKIDYEIYRNIISLFLLFILDTYISDMGYQKINRTREVSKNYYKVELLFR